MYKPSLMFDRTPEERADQSKSWMRDDQAFFAAGACHILAYMFLEMYPDERHEIIYLKPKNELPGSHVYVRSGEWAFDHNGWTKEEDLLRITKEAYQRKYPGWECECVVMDDGLEEFCEQYNHRLPEQYAYLPWERAQRFVEQFNEKPPE